MKRINFVYWVPQGNSLLSRLSLILTKKIPFIPPIYRYGTPGVIKWPDPIHAPPSITYYLLKALREKNKVRLYHVTENTTCNLKENDILLAHFWPDMTQPEWDRPDHNAVAYKTLLKFPGSNIIALGPYNHDLKQIGWMKEIFLKKKDTKFIIICGTPWYETWEHSPFYNILPRENVFQVNMAIDANEYPVVKERFNPKNKRKFLYIGRTNYPKNTQQLEKIATAYKDFSGGYISPGNIDGWNKISDFVHLTPAFMKEMAKEFDFFLSTSEADAQATTVLEQMCFGLGIAATPESGFNYSSIMRLDKNDTAFNVSQIEKIQNMEEEEIFSMCKKNREIVEQEHNWETFCQRILNFINQ